MENYQIFVDLSCDIDKDIAKKYNIGFIPMNYSIDEKEYISDNIMDENKMKEFYDKMRKGSMTKTSQITPFIYEEFFKDYAKSGSKILYITLSSGLSNTYNSAILAKNNLEDEYKDFKIEVVDSLGATGGIGLLALYACKNLENGMSLEDNAKYIKDLTKKLRHWFFVDDLKYLKRGGRVSSSKAFIASTLNIKPIMHINSEGKLEAISKKIGIRRACIELVNRFFETRDLKYNVIYITHGDDLESANNVKRLLLEKDNNLEIYLTNICPVIGSHAGPGTVALCHIAK